MSRLGSRPRLLLWKHPCPPTSTCKGTAEGGPTIDHILCLRSLLGRSNAPPHIITVDSASHCEGVHPIGKDHAPVLVHLQAERTHDPGRRQKSAAFVLYNMKYSQIIRFVQCDMGLRPSSSIAVVQSIVITCTCEAMPQIHGRAGPLGVYSDGFEARVPRCMQICR